MPYIKKYKTNLLFDNFIIRDHTVHEIRVLPGVTLIDMIYRYMREEFPDNEIILKKILFKKPIAATEEFNKQIILSLEKESVSWRISISSQKIKNGEILPATLEENAECEMYLSPKQIFLERIDLALLKSSAKIVGSMEDVYAFARSIDIIHRDFMKAGGQVYLGQDYLLMELSLGQLAHRYLDHFYIHPVYLDAATFSTGAMLLFKPELTERKSDKPYIPLYIDEFKALMHAKSQCYILVPLQVEVQETRDIITNSLKAYNEYGDLLFIMSGFTAKQIRTKELIKQLGIISPADTNQMSTSLFTNVEISHEPISQPEKNIPSSSATPTTLSAIKQELSHLILSLLNKPGSKLDETAGFYDLGLDSTQLLQIVRELESKLNCQLYPTLLFEHNTIEKLSLYLMENYAANYTADNKILVPRKAEVSLREHSTYAYQPIWEISPLTKISMNHDPILVFTDQDDFVKNPLWTAHSIILVSFAQAFRKNSTAQYQINPLEVQDYKTFFESLGQLPKQIIYKIKTPSTACYTHLLLLSQALMSLNLKEKVEMLCVAEKLSPDMSGVASFAKTLTQEFPKINCRVIYTSRVDEIFSELQSDNEREVRYDKSGTRWIKRLAEINYSTKQADAITFKPQGHYLVTGGLGGLGLICANYLAKHYQAKLVLMGRSPLTQDKQSAIDYLEKLGAEVIYLSVDISNVNALNEALLYVKTRLGSLHGIIHSAGVLKDALIINKTLSSSNEVMRPKIIGTQNLDELTSKEPLDFFVMFSSVVAVFGNVGQCDYAYANGFMDGFAKEREQLREEGRRFGRTIAIDWPLWAKGGMQMDEKTSLWHNKNAGISTLSTEQGLQVLINALKHPYPQQVIFSGHQATIEQAFNTKVVSAKEEISFDHNKTSEKINEKNIAIIGMSGCYPEAPNLAIFWENLKTGKDCIKEIPKERWDYQVDFNPEPNTPGKSYGKWGGFIDDVDKFDPLFFNISPREAEIIDPQERLFLETAWKTIEDAGHTKDTLKNKKVGVFVGVMYEQYQLYGAEAALKGYPIALSSFGSSVANRVSYCLNFHGPSIALDTMCSSSLTAIHLACKSIQDGECELALAGGVNVSIHPNKYLLLSQNRMLSPDGRCRSFSANANGYVPGEGVGAILLKPLKKALADGDHIYGVIKGSSLNHSGKTGGYTVPDPTEQAALIAEALNIAEINPETISYIEAHGTGTSLGDPIEIAGLMKVFGKRETVCPIGSVKSNIGHCESAAGIAAVMKVLLQLQHKTFVPSIHADVLNPNIDWKNISFKVQKELEAWREPTLNNMIHPRRAGISSFGAGGANAHLIIEEAPHALVSTPIPKLWHLITLSAKHPDSLKQNILNLHNWLNEHPNLAIEAVAYTLNMGRNHFNYRVALVVKSVEDLILKLAQIKAGEKSAWIFQSAPTDETDQLSKAETHQTLANSQLEKIKSVHENEEEYQKILLGLANLYVQGVDFPWQQLYPNPQLKISLPTYAFLKKRYWIADQLGNFKKTMVTKQDEALHALVGWNASTSHQQLFKTQLLPDAYYLKDHLVQGEKVLPGAVYVEMARAACEMITDARVKEIRDIYWLRPLILKETPIDAAIALSPKNENLIYYEISTGDADKPIIHSKGELYVGLPETHLSAWKNLSDLEANFPISLTKEMIYERFKALGLAYGDAFQTLEWVKVRGQEILAHYQLPAKLNQEASNFVLHPSLLDAALQSIIGFSTRTGGQLFLPFKIAAIRLMQALPPTGYIYIRPSENLKNNQLSCDLQIWDKNGMVCAEIKGFVCKAIQKELNSTLMKEKKLSPEDKLLQYYYSHWVTENLPLTIIDEMQSQIKMLCVLTDNEEIIAALRKQLSSNIVWIKRGAKYQVLDDYTYEVHGDLVQAYERIMQSLKEKNINITHVLLAQGWVHDNNEQKVSADYIEYGLHETFTFTKVFMKQLKTPIKWLVIYPLAQGILSPAVMLTGFAKSLKQENPLYEMSVVGLDVQESLASLSKKMVLELLAPIGFNVHVRYRFMGTTRQVERYAEMNAVEAASDIPFKKNGVYLITGGLGGLGFIFARYLAKEYQARLILTGRSALDAMKEALIKELKALGAEVLYLCGDVAEPNDTKTWITESKNKFGVLQGVIHSAGVLHDALLINKNWEEFRKTIMPKVLGSLYLDNFTAHEHLECFVLFSSITSCFGNMGQSDYACANAFMDAFAKWRSEKVNQNQRYGKTVSINWPLWVEGGMQVNKATQHYMEETLGMKLLPTSFGLKAFDFSLSQLQAQLLVLYGPHEFIHRLFNRLDSSGANEKDVSSFAKDSAEKVAIIKSLISDLQRILGEIIKLAPQEISPHENLMDYGLDSITFTDFSYQLQKELQLAVAPTIYFERPTLKLIAHYLWDHHQMALLQHYNVQLPLASQELTSEMKSDVANDLSHDAILKIYEKTYLNFKHLNIVIKKIQGVDIEIVSAGVGPPILFLSPLDCISTIWRHQLKTFSKNHQVIAIHYPGCGRSGFDSALVETEKLVELLNEALLSLALNQAMHVIGWSSGGILAQYFTLKYPKLIKSLTLVNSAAKHETETAQMNLETLKTLQQDFMGNAKVNLEGITQQQIFGLSTQAAKLYYLNKLFKLNTIKLLNTINVPTLIIAGGHDKVFPPACSVLLNNNIKHSELVILKSAGHYIPLFHPKFFNKKVLDFINVK